MFEEVDDTNYWIININLHRICVNNKNVLSNRHDKFKIKINVGINNFHLNFKK